MTQAKGSDLLMRCMRTRKQRLGLAGLVAGIAGYWLFLQSLPLTSNSANSASLTRLTAGD